MANQLIVLVVVTQMLIVLQVKSTIKRPEDGADSRVWINTSLDKN